MGLRYSLPFTKMSVPYAFYNLRLINFNPPPTPSLRRFPWCHSCSDCFWRPSACHPALSAFPRLPFAHARARCARVSGRIFPRRAQGLPVSLGVTHGVEHRSPRPTGRRRASGAARRTAPLFAAVESTGRDSLRGSGWRLARPVLRWSSPRGRPPACRGRDALGAGSLGSGDRAGGASASAPVSAPDGATWRRCPRRHRVRRGGGASAQRARPGVACPAP